MDDPRLWVLQEALASYASDPDDPPLDDTDAFRAAVALVVRGGDPLQLLLIKRAQHPSDPWSGHMALPGGREDPADVDLAATAVRETREETGVDLTAGAVPLGRLRPLRPGSRRLPSLLIAPYVWWVPSGTAAVAASREVDTVHWVALDRLRAPATHSSIEVEVGDGPRTFPCLEVEGEVVWGLTFRILQDFFDRFPDAAFSSGD